MKTLLPIFLLIVDLLSITNIPAQNSKLKYGKEPTWVRINTINYNNKKLEGDAEDGYLDVDFEKQVCLMQQASYYKKIIQILSEAGVQNSSEISINFDPAYEQLIFHTIQVIRNGTVLNKLNLSKFKIIQQEKELARHMYDGSLTALLVLDDVRKGDIIQYSYTIKGFNPIFDNKYSDVYYCRYGVPVANLYYKLIVPESKNIVVKNNETNIAPSITNNDDEKIYEWKAVNISALHLESKVPGWYDPYAEIMVSEFNNWKDVSNWATALFPKNLKLSPELIRKVNTIKETYSNNEARTLAALHFVQDDIRYMGIEIGENSHKPSHPNKIFAQRFGDCKDKSYLLVTMLNAMGIDANAVLINTSGKKTIAQWLPSPTVFDHCTVQAKVNDKLYWFDPTISFQRGTINDISYPDYQMGLVINDTTSILSPISFHDKGSSDTKEIFNVIDTSGFAKLKVITTNTGSFADDVRSSFNNNSLYEIKNKYKDFYAYYFDKIIIDSLTYENDDLTGTFKTIEYYTIRDMWKTDEGKKKLSFSAYVINSIMSKPSDKNRTMPFYLTYPARYKEQIEINMPEEWPVKPINNRVECAGFRLAEDIESVGNRITLNYTYENLKDNVLPNEAAGFFSNYDEAFKHTGYELFYDLQNNSSITSHSVDPVQSNNLFPKLYAVLGAAVLITFLVRRQKRKEA